MARKKLKKLRTRMEIIAEGNLPEPLENLRLRLSSPRLRARGTIKSYLETSQRFLMGVDGDKPSENDLRRYFLKRRQHGISDRTLRKEFFHLKKLSQANPWGDWPFTKEDTPFPEEPITTVALDIPIIEQLIASRKKYTERERFYLAVSTTWGCRREEMARIEKRHIAEDDTIQMPRPPMTLFIKTAKHGRPVKHLIPPNLQMIFDAYRPKPHQPEAMSTIFKRICDKAGVKREYGWGWHSIRRSLVTVLTGALPKNNLDPAMLADYMGWAKSSMAGIFGGAAMVGFYRRPEILDSDPYGLDKLIYGIHPFLPLWREKELAKTSTERRKHAKATSSTSKQQGTNHA